MIKLRILLVGVLFSYTLQSSAHQELIDTGSTLFWIYVLISFGLSCFAGVCSGLTVGYMAINKQEMEMWAKSDNQEQKRMSKPILDVLSNHHLLLSTLLLANALSLEALPIFLDKIVPGYMAIIISTMAVVVFGQVLPQSYCTGPNKNKIGYYLAGFVKFLECILYIFVKPIVYILDNWLGHHDDKLVLSKQNLRAILYLHNNRQYGYRPEEIEILQNTIDLRAKLAKSHMIKLENTFSISEEAVVDEELISELEKVNLSKVPVYSGKKSNVIGYIKVKHLLIFNISQKKKLKNGNIISQIMKIDDNSHLLQIIEMFKNNMTNFGAVIDHQTKQCIGVITQKQIFEKLVLKEFKDNDIRVNMNFGEEKGVLNQVVEGKEQD